MTPNPEHGNRSDFVTLDKTMVRAVMVIFVGLLTACSSATSTTVPLVSPSTAATSATASSGRVSPSPPAPASGFAGAQAAAIGGATQLTGAIYLPGATDVITSCPAGAAKCLAIQGEVDGTRAAYFRAYLGNSAGDALCGIYTVLEPTGWHFLDMGCDGRESGQQFPDLGGVDYVFNTGTSCANVRAAPGLLGKVVGCLKGGTTVNIDGGPVYVIEADSSASHLWWHLQGSGWMAHDYLILLYV